MKPLRLHRIAWIAIIALVALGLLAHYDGVSYRSTIPVGYRYLPPGAITHSSSLNISQAWKAIANHVGDDQQVFDQEHISILVNFWYKLQDEARAMCIFADSVDLLEQIGISTDGPLTIGTYSSTGPVPKTVVAIPIKHRQRFLELLSPDKGYTIQLHGQISDKKPIAYQVRLSSDHPATRLCDSESSQQLTSKYSSFLNSQSGKYTLYVSPYMDSDIELTCLAVYRDGTTGGCGCQIEGTHANVCRVNFASNEQTFVRGSLRVLDLPQDRSNINEDDAFIYLTMMNDGVAIASNHYPLFESASMDSARNYQHYANDSGLRRIDELRKRTFLEGTEVLAGSWSLSVPFGSGSVAYVVHFGELLVDVAVLPTLDYFETTSLRRLTTSLSDTAIAVPWPMNSKLGLSISDPHTSSYIGNLYRFFGPETEREHLNRRDGPGALFRLLRDLQYSDVSGLAVHVVGVRSGIPMVSIGLSVRSDKHATRIVRTFQETLRAERDIAILNEARLRSSVSDHAFLQAVETGNPIGVSDESPNAWNVYGLHEGGFYRMHEYTDELFESEFVHYSEDQLRIDFLVPPVTVNDLDYRLGQTGTDEYDRDEITSGNNRIVAHHDEKAGLLWMATNVDALVRTLANDNRVSRSNSLGIPAGHGSFAKVIGEAYPGWLVSELRNYFEEVVRNEFGATVLLAGRYEKAVVTISPEGRLGGVLVRARASY